MNRIAIFIHRVSGTSCHWLSKQILNIGSAIQELAELMYKEDN